MGQNYLITVILATGTAVVILQRFDLNSFDCVQVQTRAKTHDYCRPLNYLKLVKNKSLYHSISS